MNDIMAKSQNNQLGMVEESRQFAEIQGKVFLAKQFPRDEERAMKRILMECQRPQLAESATYVYARGNSEVKGASIRLAEVVARHWGNIDCGVVELEQKNGVSTVKTYAWDLESNFDDHKIFTVKHERSTKSGNYAITDPRDIYEFVANNAARRKRACILAVIPGYVFDAAVEACEKTLQESARNGKTIEERMADMLEAFRAFKPDITPEMLGAKVGKDFDKIDARDFVKLKNLYNAIKDGFVKAAIAFGEETEDLPSTEEDAELEEINKEMGVDNG